MKYQHLKVEEHEEIQLGLLRGESLRIIAKRLDRDHTSLGREISRNSSPVVEKYTPRLAEGRAQAKRSNRGRVERLKNETVRTYVVEQLKESWSPEQIAGSIKAAKGETISHEAIQNGFPSTSDRWSSICALASATGRATVSNRRTMRQV